MSQLTHFDEAGATRMVDVGAKAVTTRVAKASGCVRMQAETLRLIRNREMAKGDVLEVARLAGIMASKQTSNLIPLCHSLPLDSVSVNFSFPDEQMVRIEAVAAATARTGVEMEALTTVAVAALTLYDMCKSVDRAMQITQIQLEEKSGGKTGTWSRATPAGTLSSS
jgi:cyclic pyranopterin phosphate synthase